MKAFARDIYGGPEVLELREVERPSLKDDRILVKVCANSANPADWHILRGTPFFSRFTFGLLKPRDKILGADFSGTVAESGSHSSMFKVGDRVFGGSIKGGAFSEYVSVPESVCAVMPEGLDFSQMASLPTAGVTALQAVVRHGKLKKGETVLINGASGGVGHFAVQIAKNTGAKVVAVCSGKNADFARRLGADEVIEYDKVDIHRHNEQYDLVIDVNGNLDHRDFKRMGQRGVMVGFTSMGHMMALMIRKTFDKYPLVQFTADVNSEDLTTLAVMAQEGKIRAFVDRSFSYEAIPEAVGYIEAMRTKGKVVMVWDDVE